MVSAGEIACPRHAAYQAPKSLLRAPRPGCGIIANKAVHTYPILPTDKFCGTIFHQDNPGRITLVWLDIIFRMHFQSNTMLHATSYMLLIFLESKRIYNRQADDLKTAWSLKNAGVSTKWSTGLATHSYILNNFLPNSPHFLVTLCSCTEQQQYHRAAKFVSKAYFKMNYTRVRLSNYTFVI